MENQKKMSSEDRYATFSGLFCNHCIDVNRPCLNYQMELDDPSIADFPPPPPPDELSDSDKILPVPMDMPETDTLTTDSTVGTTDNPADGQQAVPGEKPSKGETSIDETEEKGQPEKTRKDNTDL